MYVKRAMGITGFNKLIGFLGGLALLIGCAGNPAATNSGAAKEKSKDVESATRKSVAHEFFVRGRHQEMLGNEKVALDFYTISFQYDSTSRELCFFLSRKHKEMGEYKKALEFGLRGLSLDGEENIHEYKLLGETYLRLGHLGKSVEYYKKARKLDEYDRDVLYTLLTIYEQEGSISEQSDVLSKLLPLVDYPERLVDKMAKLYKSQGKYKQLVAMYEAAWEETGLNIFGERLANVYESLEMFSNFLEVYQTLFKQEPGNIYYKVQVARAFLTMGENDSAFQYYEELVKEYPEKEQFVYTYATLLFFKERYEEAKGYFLKLLEEYPENSTYHYYLASCGDMLGDKALASLEYHKAVNMNKNILEYWAKLGIFLMRDEKYSEAIKLFKDMVTHHEKSPYAWYLYGISFNRNAEYLDREMRNKAEPDSSLGKKANYMRGKAIEKFKKSLKIEPGDPKVLFELGVAYERNLQENKSIEAFKKLISIDSANSAALNYLGYMLVEANKELPLAIKYIDRALKSEPNNGAYLDSKGWYYYKVKNFEKAKEYIEKALATGTKDVTIIEHLALILEELGEVESAKEQWALILKLNPNHKLANSKLN